MRYRFQEQQSPSRVHGTPGYFLWIAFILLVAALGCSPSDSPPATGGTNVGQQGSIAETGGPVADSGGEDATEAKDPGDAVAAVPQPGPPELTRAELSIVVSDGIPRLELIASATDYMGDDAEIVAEWLKNGEPVDVEGTEMTDFRRDDEIRVTVTPYDGDTYGRSRTLSIGIANAPPVIRNSSEYGFDGRRFTYAVVASDADEDELSYGLVNGPDGMTVDPETGQVSWDVPDQFTGEAAGTVEVTDGHGGKAVYSFDVTITEIAADAGRQ